VIEDDAIIEFTELKVRKLEIVMDEFW